MLLAPILILGVTGTVCTVTPVPVDHAAAYLQEWPPATLRVNSRYAWFCSESGKLGCCVLYMGDSGFESLTAPAPLYTLAYHGI